MSSPKQLPLTFRTWGGRRPGAGRPRVKGSGVSHLRRPKHSSRHPVHVTWRVREGLPSLRQKRAFRAIRASIAAARERHGSRVVHFSVQGNHLHLLVEAGDRTALLVALRALGIRLARAVNHAFSRRGSVLADRYHARALKTPLEVRRALRYVLLNARHHAGQREQHVPGGWIDGCSSAQWFQGWRDPDAIRRAILVPRAGPERSGRRRWRTHTNPGRDIEQAPVARPKTWLLATGWKRWGLLDPDETPGPRS